MKINLKQHLIIAIFLPILSLLTCLAYAENVEEIIEAQEELNTTSNEEKKASQKQQNLLNKTKDAVAMGKDEYQRTCSLCHGIDGKGHGVYAFELKVAPTDLTLIEKKNYGVFPFSKLYKIIDGRNEVKSHGARDMPVWGDRYKSESWLYTNAKNSETLVRGQIFELLLYLETIQK
jgi:mono/diheme cytochrome c family protein